MLESRHPVLRLRGRVRVGASCGRMNRKGRDSLSLRIDYDMDSIVELSKIAAARAAKLPLLTDISIYPE